MREALVQAEQAAAANEVPVGAVVVLNNEIIGSGFNRTIIDCDPSAHAEVVALREAAKHVSNYRLLDACLYVTLEPCLMCCGCLVHARVKRLVFGAREPKTGCVVSVNESLAEPSVLHRVGITEGVLAAECQKILQSFFNDRRG